MDLRVVNLKEKAGLIHELQACKIITRLNDYTSNWSRHGGNSSGTGMMKLMKCSWLSKEIRKLHYGK